MTKHKIFESFSWLTPEAFSLEDVGRNKVRIKGVALKSNAISKNRRKYMDEEVLKSARTLIGKPITINHDMNKIVGNIEWAEYENGALEYYGIVKKQPFVGLLRSHSPDIKGVSVEAGYLHNKCPICGDKFYSEEAFADHMNSKHHVKEGITQPHGINFSALSLVVSPEIPGVRDTTIDLMETFKPLSQLSETVTSYRKEQNKWRNKMAKVATVTPQKSITIAKAQKLREQETPEEDIKPGSHYCEEHPDDPRCKAHKKAIHGDNVEEQTQQELPEPTVEPAGCPEGFEPDGIGGCKPKEWPELPVTAKVPAPQITPEPTIELPKVPAPPIPAPAPVAGPVLEQDEGASTIPEAPFPTAPPVAPAAITHECPAGSHYDAENDTCVPDDIVEQPPGLEGRVDAGADIVSEIKLPKILTLGEPFADYSSFEDCVTDIMNRNPEYSREQAEGTCAKIEKQATGKYPSQETKETTSNIYEMMKKISGQTFITDRKLAESLNQQNRAIAKLTQIVRGIPQKISKQTFVESRLRAGYNRAIMQSVQTNAITNRQSNIAIAKSITEIAKTNQQFNKTLCESLNASTKLNTQSTRVVLEYIQKVAQAQTRYFAGLVRNLSECSRTHDAAIATYTKNLATEHAKLSKRVGDSKTAFKALGELNVKFLEHKQTTEGKLTAQQDELDKRKCPEGKHYDEEQEKCVPNATEEKVKELEEKLAKITDEQKKKAEKEVKETESLTVRVENLEAKQKGQFKGKSEPVGKDEGVYSPRDPPKKKKR